MKVATRLILACSPWTVCGASAQTLPNGVAAGDVDQTSAILWAHSTAIGEIVIEYAANSSFADAETVAAEVTDPTVPVKVEAGPLMAGTTYFYRATDSSGAMAEGTFRTPAADGYHGLRFGVSGDWRGELAPYPSIANVPESNLDFFVAQGDTIYADVPSIDFPDEQARTVEEFRIKHNEVYSERFGRNGLAELRASTALLACVDDHEVTNDFSGGAPPESDPRFDQTGAYINETQLWSNGMSVFQEYYPIRDEYYGDTGDPRTAGKRKLYRFRRYGHDAAIMMLDARSFRDQGLPELLAPPGPREFQEYVAASFDSSRTMLGEVQLAELMDDLLFAKEEGITWKFVLVPEPIQNLGPILAGDRFEGYAYERTALLSFIEENEIRNVVFIAADIHGTIVNNVAYQLRPGDPQITTSMFEITTGSVAYAAPFGPTTIAHAGPLIGGLYERLDHDGQNNLVTIISNVLLSLYGYPHVGLDWSPVDAQLLDGGYVVVNTYGWTEFEIDAASQCLTVTTYGIDWYDEEELFDDPDEVLGREPKVVSRFRVEPQLPLNPVAGANIDAERANCNVHGNTCGAIGGMGLSALGLMLLGLFYAPYVRARFST
jgi:phosphodiesterase/alkaline phosphatase D-like protein